MIGIIQGFFLEKKDFLYNEEKRMRIKTRLILKDAVSEEFLKDDTNFAILAPILSCV